MYTVLDLFCGAGGASMGYHRAGFSVVGVDIKPQPRYPFEFHQGDALEFAAQHGHEFDLIHASPPCQGYSKLRFLPQNKLNHYPLLIEPTRTRLRTLGKPYIIENIHGAPLVHPMVLNGVFFGLTAWKVRDFECSPWLLAPILPKKPKGRNVAPINEFEKGQYGLMRVAGQSFSVPHARKAMDISWMTRAELAQAIPPAYTEYIGGQMLRFLERREAV